MDEVRRALVFDAEQELVKLKARKKLVARAGLELPPLLSGIRVTATSKRRLIRRASGVEQQRAGAAAAVVGEEFRGPEYRTYKVLSVFWSLVEDCPLCLFYDVEEHSEADEEGIVDDPSAFAHAHVSVCDDVSEWVKNNPAVSV